MSFETLIVIALLIVTGCLVLGLETGILEKYKGYVAGLLVVLVTSAIGLFLLNDSRGKIDWGDPIKAEKAKSKKKKKHIESSDGGGDDPREAKENGKGGEDGSQNSRENSGDPSEVSVVKKRDKPKNSKPIRKFKDCDECPQMVVIDAGEFRMGSPDKEYGHRYYEAPVTAISISREFAVSQMEIANWQYAAFIKATGHRSNNECVVEGVQTAGANYRRPGFSRENDFPVVCVSWHDAKAYVAWLNKKTSGGYRLLSEAEWEYAARAGSKGSFATKHGISSYEANFSAETKTPKAISDFAPNEFGLHNMHGNVSEWVEDCWHDTYQKRPKDAQPWLEQHEGDCKSRVHRGGAWPSDVTEIRSAARNYESLAIAHNTIGIRVAKDM